MHSDWPRVRLGDHVDSCLGKMLDKKKNKGIEQPYLGNSNVRWGEFDLSDLAQMKFEDSEHERYGITSGDLIVCEGGEPGRCAIWKEELPDMKIQKALHRVRTKSSLNNRYLYYWFLHAGKHGLLEPYFTGTTIKHLTEKALNNLVIPLPPLSHQEFLAEILGGLDDKIQLNHQINRTLEQMAQAIFKSWFVDFEPVKAKIAARERWQAMQPGNESASPVCYAAETESFAPATDLNTWMTQAAMRAVSGKADDQLAHLQTEQPEQYAELRATAELFPSSMQDSELGEIPEGWSCQALDEIAKYQNGLALQKFRPENEDDYLPVLKIAQLRKGYTDGEEKASPSIKSECIVDNGDIVFSWSGSLMVDSWCGGKAALNQHLFKVTSENYPKWLYFHFTRHHLEEFQRIAADKAVTMGHIKREHLKRALCAIPGEQLIEKAGSSLRNILEKQIEIRLESITLSTLRDTLLPRMLSGELFALETEKHTEICA